MDKIKPKGRGSAINPANRFQKLHIEDLPADEKDHLNNEEPETKLSTMYFTDHSQSVISENDSPDVGFDYSFNPYKGCEHGCIYCYARPTHEYIGFSSGLDFETKIMVKTDAPALLEKKFKSRSYNPDVIIFSGNTDCYQPVERRLELTRRSLAVCAKYRNPVSLITKNALILRDIDILKELNELNLVKVTLSITTLNKDLQRVMEPRTSSPALRLKAIEQLAAVNIPVGVNLAPIIPGLNDEEIPAIIEAAANAGADSAGYITLRLPYAVKDLFKEWLEREFPGRKEKILNKLREMNGGKLYSSERGVRFTGTGVLADNIKNLFELSCRKHNLNKRIYDLNTAAFRKEDNRQLEMF